MHLQHSLVSRSVRRHVTAENNKELLAAILPIGAKEALQFDSSSPTVAAMKMSLQTKIEMFESVLFNQVLVSYIQLGEPGCKKAAQVTQASLDALNAIDTLELDTETAKLYSHWNEVLRFLTALLDSEVDLVDYADSSGPCKKQFELWRQATLGFYCWPMGLVI